MLYHLADLRADFATFYHVADEEFYRQSGQLFFERAFRVGAHEGVIAARIANDKIGATSSSPSPAGGKVREVSIETLASDPTTRDLLEIK